MSNGIYHQMLQVSVYFLQTLTCGAATLKEVPVVGLAGRGEMLFWAWT